MEKPRYDVFLSHATPDKPVVEELARLLKKRGFEPWLDKWNLIPGEPWQTAVEEALRNCATCAVCIGPSGTGPWQNAEMRAAINRRVSGKEGGFRVIPVLLPKAEGVERSQLSDFLTETTWVEFHETLDDEQALYRLICGIQGIPPGPDPGEAVAEGACPYRGLQVFDVDDALFFFGREELTSRLLDKLGTDRAGTRFLAVVGPSGSGKSSLARAGLLASLKSGRVPGSDVWPVSICKPGAEPLQSLSLAFAKAFRRDSSDVLKLTRDLAADTHTLHIATNLSLSEAPADRRLVVLVDQFEEVFTLCGDEGQRRALIDNLLYAATAPDGQTVVILTLRADFYGRCAAYPNLAAAVSDHQSLVGPMSREELRSAIQRPAYLAGCELEGGLADLLLNEVEAQPGSLPLLEHALLQIWQRREGGRRLTVAAYHEIGGVAGALEKHAEEVYGGFDEAEGEVCHQDFLRLVQVDEQGRATRRRLSLDDLVPEITEDGKPIKTVVARLIDARLLTSDREKRPTVELAHEALLANWKRLKQWIDQDRDALRTRRRLDEAVAEWLGKDRDPPFLLEGGRLVQVEEWANSHPEEKTPERQELLAASIAERGKERQRELDQARRQRRWTLISLIAAALALVAAVSTGYLWRVADQRQKITLAGQLAEQSTQVLRIDPLVSLLLSIKAFKLAEGAGQPHLPSAEAALRSVLSNARGVPLPTGKIRAASLSADSSWIAISGTDGVVSIWNLEANSGPVKVASLPGRPRAQTRQLAISSGGRWLLVADQNGDSRLFRLENTKNVSSVSLAGEDWLARNDPFSPDSRWLLTRSKNASWRIRNLTQPDQPITASLIIDPKAFAFSPDGRWLAIAELGNLRIWNLETLRSNVNFSQASLDGILRNAPALAFSADSQWVVAGESAPESGIVQAWRVKPALASNSPSLLQRCSWSSSEAPAFLDPALVSRIASLANCLMVLGRNQGDIPIAHGQEKITASVLGPQKKSIFVGSNDGTLWTKNITRADSLREYDDFWKGPFNLLASQGNWLVAQSSDEAPKVFDEKIASLEPKNIEIAQLAQDITRSYSPSGLRLTFDPSSNLRLWGAHGSWPLMKTLECDNWSFSSDGRWLAAFSNHDGRPRVWHLEVDGRPSLPILFPVRYAHPSHVTALTFSPDGHWLASGDLTGTSCLWNLKAPASEPQSLTNHRGMVNALAFNSDGTLLATTGNDGEIRIYRIAEKQAPRVLPEHPENHGEPITALTFLSGDRLATGSINGRVLLWESGKEVPLESKSNGARIINLIANPRGILLAGLTNIGDAQIWYSNDNGDLKRTPVSLPAHGLSIGFTPDGFGLEVNNLILELRTEKLLETACRAVGRNLTEREWKEYIPSETYQEREPCPEFPKAYD